VLRLFADARRDLDRKTGKYPARLHLTDWIPGLPPENPKLLVPDWTKYLPLEEKTTRAVAQADPRGLSRVHADGIQRKGAKAQRRKVDTAKPELERLTACAHEKVMPKTDNKVLQNPCFLASLRLCVKSLLHSYGLGTDPTARP